MLKPYVSEKSYQLANSENKYVFFADNTISKLAVKDYVEVTYKVKVENVTSVTIPGKMKKNWAKNIKTRKTDSKKYIVKLKSGDRIEDFFNV